MRDKTLILLSVMEIKAAISTHILLGVGLENFSAVGARSWSRLSFGFLLNSGCTGESFVQNRDVELFPLSFSCEPFFHDIGNKPQ